MRWAGHDCDSIRDGDHIAIFSGTTLSGNSTADPSLTTNPVTSKPHPRTPTSILSAVPQIVSDVVCNTHARGTTVSRAAA